MSKPISSYPKAQQMAVIERRLRVKTNGAGYWAAAAAWAKLGKGALPGATPPKVRSKHDDNNEPAGTQKLRRRIPTS